MAIETRTIQFSQEELIQASYAYCIRQGLAAERGKLKSVVAGPEGRDEVRLMFDVVGRAPTQLTLTYSQMAAALILHCGVVGIPLPRYSRKRLTPAGEGMALIVRLSEADNEVGVRKRKALP